LTWYWTAPVGATPLFEESTTVVSFNLKKLKSYLPKMALIASVGKVAKTPPTSDDLRPMSACCIQEISEEWPACIIIFMTLS
jgi:hypothetical protein